MDCCTKFTVVHCIIAVVIKKKKKTHVLGLLHSALTVWYGKQGFEKTGLGERVATLFVKAFGKSTLGLA
jgi:Sodium:sulfate symporter transmembrane region